MAILVRITLATRDVSQDVPCDGCGRPLWRIYSEGPYELAWGHTSAEDAQRCPITRRRGQWPTPRDPREHTESEKWCRHPHCWGGSDRMHLRDKVSCPPYDPSHRHHRCAPETRAFLEAYAHKLRGEG